MKTFVNFAIFGLFFPPFLGCVISITHVRRGRLQKFIFHREIVVSFQFAKLFHPLKFCAILYVRIYVLASYKPWGKCKGV